MNPKKKYPFKANGLQRCLLCCILFLLSVAAHAQRQAPFTGGNEVILNIPGETIPYSYFSNQMFVRLDVAAKRFEINIPLNSFIPANTGSPQVLQRELFLTSAYPEMVLMLNAPLEILLTESRQPQKMFVEGTLLTQGSTRDVKTEINFIPLPDQVTFSCIIRFDLHGPNVVLPQSYVPLVQGYAELVIQNARWLNPNPQR